MKNKLKFKSIGCDPELFFVDKKTGRPYSAEGIIPGTKEDPHYITKNGHMIQLDNVLVEFGIPPCSSLSTFKDNVNYVLNYLRNKYGDRFEIGKMASAEMDDEHVQSEHAKLFGCDPDFNAWTEDQNPKPCPTGNLRSAGGHIHIGVDGDWELDDVIKFIKLCDLMLAIPSVLIDKDERRKELYGKAGAFRFKPYFAEYRTLSNFWIHENNLMDLVYNQLLKAFDLFNNEEESDRIIKVYGSQIVDAINSNNKAGAEELVKKLNIL